MPPWNVVRPNSLQHLDFPQEEFVEMMWTMDLLPLKSVCGLTVGILDVHVPGSLFL
jgi:hypothetical protein